MLKLDSLNLEFDNFHRPLINNLNLELYEGDFLVIIGGNGSGKSSLLKLINGLYRPTKGKIVLNNKSLLNQPIEKISQEISTLTQDLAFSTFSSLTILENFEVASCRTGHKLPCQSELVSHLDHFHPDLKNHLNTTTRRLSGGQRQALALAMILLYPPKLLLLDEHTSALDPKTGHKIMELTSCKIREHAITSLMITHELEDALRFGNRLIALKEGEIIFEAAGNTKASLTKKDLLELCF